MRGPQYFDAETISAMKSAFDETCAAVPQEHLSQGMRPSIADLKLAGTGERDRVRLRDRTLMEVCGVPKRGHPTAGRPPIPLRRCSHGVTVQIPKVALKGRSM
jgi:hypothetical protein